MPGKKIKLDCASYEELSLIGITSIYPSYKLVHYLNNSLHFSFRKQADLPYYFTEESMDVFTLYYHLYAERMQNWFLISNKSIKNKILVKSLKGFDYFILIDDLMLADDLDAIVSGLRKENGIQMASRIDIHKIKNIEHIYADLEMHLMDIQHNNQKPGKTLNSSDED